MYNEKDEKEKYKRCKIKNLTIPGSVNAIVSGTFQMTSLETVTIGEGVTQIGVFAFNGCKYLKTVKLPSTLTAIFDDAFENCESLTNITLPSNLEHIYSYAFKGCKNLKTITIPQNIKKVEKTAFDGCTNLKIKYNGKTYTVETFKKLSIENNNPDYIALTKISQEHLKGSTKVTISCETKGAKIYYTTDGSSPTEKSKLYTGPITFTKDTRLKIRVFKDGKGANGIIKASITVSN